MNFMAGWGFRPEALILTSLSAIPACKRERTTWLMPLSLCTHPPICPCTVFWGESTDSQNHNFGGHRRLQWDVEICHFMQRSSIHAAQDRRMGLPNPILTPLLPYTSLIIQLRRNRDADTHCCVHLHAHLLKVMHCRWTVPTFGWAAG